jgi:D-alanyl-D-alanine carboxypeptidase/D-alanyl-D-alanine-endopeptidase (penicillin-binding protein 4)
VSVWVDGLGEVAAHNPDQPLLPASNQKMLTAMSVLASMPGETTLATEIRSAGPQVGPVLQGDLFLVGGGDPTLTRHGPHSLDALAGQIAARGIQVVSGSLIGDESRYDAARSAPGWRPEHVPIYIGPLSALVVDRNQHRGDPAYAADPLPGNVAVFRAALIRHGVKVAGPDGRGTAPPGTAVLAALTSPPVGRLVHEMLLRSDNLFAELLLKEVGLRVRGAGTSAAGLVAGAEVLGQAHVPTDGESADGSGLSRANHRSARQWRTMLQAALTQPWGRAFREALPVAGHSGTLSRRMRAGPVAGNVRAKTGWIDEARALSGYLTTGSGRNAVFSILINGTTPATKVIPAIDELVATIAADDS